MAAIVADEDKDDDDNICPEAHKIDWTSLIVIRNSLALFHTPEQYENKTVFEQVVVLANNFTPTDICPVYMLTTAHARYESK